MIAQKTCRAKVQGALTLKSRRGPMHQRNGSRPPMDTDNRTFFLQAVKMAAPSRLPKTG